MSGEPYRTSTGQRIFHAQHYHRGLKVFRSTVVLRVGRKRVRRTPPLFKVPRGLALRAEIAPSDAMAAVLRLLRRRGRLAASLRFSVRSEVRFQQPDCPSVVDLRYGLASPARMHLEIFPLPQSRAELAWVGDCQLRDGTQVHFAASATGRRARVFFAAEATSCAFGARWVPVPPAPEARTFPIPPLATPGGRTGTPSAWQIGALAGGPNVSIHVGDAAGVEALGSLEVDNPFVWCNVLHDFFAEFGFDSAHHAFEVSDPLRVETLSQKSPKAGQFASELDGTRPALLLFASPSGSQRHASVDPTIVIHEYVHGVADRLVGGDRCRFPFLDVQARGFSEGTSDYFALTIVNYLDRQRLGAGSLQVFGGTFRPGGIRNYSGFKAGFLPGSKDPHRIGMVWCAAMQEGRRALATLAAGDLDRVDRFLWQAYIDTLKTMAPLCRDSLALTLVHAKSSLLSQVLSSEVDEGFPGAAARMSAAFTARGIA